MFMVDLPCSGVTRHAGAQLLQPPADPGLHGAQRQLELLGQFAVTLVTQIGQADNLALFVVELAQAVVQRKRLLAGIGRVHGVGRIALQRLGQFVVQLVHEVGPVAAAPAPRQMLRKASCSTSSATSRLRTMRKARPKSGDEVRSYSLLSAESSCAAMRSRSSISSRSGWGVLMRPFSGMDRVSRTCGALL